MCNTCVTNHYVIDYNSNISHSEKVITCVKLPKMALYLPVTMMTSRDHEMGENMKKKNFGKMWREKF